MTNVLLALALALLLAVPAQCQEDAPEFAFHVAVAQALTELGPVGTWTRCAYGLPRGDTLALAFLAQPDSGGHCLPVTWTRGTMRAIALVFPIAQPDAECTFGPAEIAAWRRAREPLWLRWCGGALLLGQGRFAYLYERVPPSPPGIRRGS